jgi:hypothetical protein
MAELKIKDDELTTAQLATFGILPQEPHRPKLVKSLDEPSNLEGSGNAEKKIEVQKWIGNAEKAVGE